MQHVKKIVFSHKKISLYRGEIKGLETFFRLILSENKLIIPENTTPAFH